MRLLVTRPEGDGERTAATLRGRGHEVLLVPMLRVEAVDEFQRVFATARGRMASTTSLTAVAIAIHI